MCHIVHRWSKGFRRARLNRVSSVTSVAKVVKTFDLQSMPSKLLTSLAAVIFIAIVTPLAAQSPERADWPLFRRDAKCSGAIQNSIGDSLTEAWTFRGEKCIFESTPIIVGTADDATVYVAGMNVDVIGKLFALSFSDGKQKWVFESPNGFSTSPAWDEQKLIVGDITGMIFGVDSSGAKIWEFESGAEINSSANFFHGNALIGSQDSNLYALNAKTGKVAWKLETADQIRCSATIAGDRCFLAGCDEFLHVVGLAEGKEVGTVRIGSPTGCTPAVLGGNIFFGNERGEFFSVDPQSLKINWQYADPAGVTSIRSSAAVTESHVVYGARNRKVVSLNPDDGIMQWETRLKGKIDSSPVIAGDRVYVGSSDGRLYILNLADGKEIWQTQLDGAIIGSPAIAFGHLIVATERGVVYCFKGSQSQ